jgi:F-type H+-transporting ATPase subunit epsilon
MLKLSILSPERKLLEGEKALEVTLTGSEGEIQILEGHAPMLGSLEMGVLKYKTSDGTLHSGVVTAGFFEVKDDVVILMCESVELKGEINVEKAKQAQAEAEQALKDANLDEHHFKKYQLQVERSLIEQQVAHSHHQEH